MIHERIWRVRKCFLFVATVVIGYYITNFKDFNRINYTMLQEIQDQICEIKKLQETQNNPTCLDDDRTLVSNADKLEEATKQLEMSLLAYSTSTPEKQSKPFGECKIPSSIPSLKFDSYEENWNQKEKTKEPDVKEIKAKVLKKKMQDLSVVGYSSDGSLSESRYNLRSRTSFNNSSLNVTAVKESKTNNRRKSTNKKAKDGSRRKPEYSSDDE